MKLISWYLVVAMFVLGVTPKLYAGFSPSEAVSLLSVDRSSDLEKIRKVLEVKMVRERLNDLGFTSVEIENKLGQLNDQQIHQLALGLDELKVGGSGWGWVVVILVLVALGVIVYFYVTGHRVIIEREK
jgi:hypothetical protein